MSDKGKAFALKIVVLGLFSSKILPIFDILKIILLYYKMNNEIGA